MAALEKTNDPGIYKRETARGDTRYVVTYWVGGKQRQATRRTLREARALKRSREADRDRGELFEASHRSFREYAAEWVESYQGNGRRGSRNRPALSTGAISPATPTRSLPIT